MNRRRILYTSSAIVAAVMAGFTRRRAANAAPATGANYRVVHTDAQWRQLLESRRL